MDQTLSIRPIHSGGNDDIFYGLPGNSYLEMTFEVQINDAMVRTTVTSDEGCVQKWNSTIPPSTSVAAHVEILKGLTVAIMLFAQPNRCLIYQPHYDINISPSFSEILSSRCFFGINLRNRIHDFISEYDLKLTLKGVVNIEELIRRDKLPGRDLDEINLEGLSRIMLGYSIDTDVIESEGWNKYPLSCTYAKYGTLLAFTTHKIAQQLGCFE